MHKSERKNGLWETQITDLETDTSYTVKSKTLINAAGPFADQYNQQNNIQTEHHHLFSKGIHLIVDAVTENPRVLAFFASDGRLFFVIPMGDKTCIGTTDNKVESPVTEVTPEDRRFVLDNANNFLKFPTPISEEDIISERCGVRPLAIKGKKDLKGDFLELSRKHAVDVNHEQSQLTIFGGKTTDCLNVGREIYDYIKAMGISNGQSNNSWFGESGDIEKQAVFKRTDQVMAITVKTTQARKHLADRLWRRYDKGTHDILTVIENTPTKAEKMISTTDITAAELEYVRDHELVIKLEDFLRRRSLIALTKGRENLAKSGELHGVCSILFGEQNAQAKVDEYLYPEQAYQAEKAS